MTKIFSAITILSLVAGIVGSHNPYVRGVATAFFGTFFILVFLVKLSDFFDAEKPETTHPAPSHGHKH